MNGIRLAVEDADPEGLPPLDTVLILEADNRSGPALEAAEFLTDISGLVAVIGHSNSTASLATSQVYNRAQVVQIAPSATAPIYSEAGAYSFRMVPPDEVQARLLAGVLRDSVPTGGRVALFYVNDDYGRNLRALVLAELATEPLEVVVDLPHAEGDIHPVDVRHHLAALVASNPDVILWLGRVPVLHALLPGIRQGLGSIAIYGGDGVSPASLATDFRWFWDGVRFVEFVDLEATPELRGFAQRFQTRFGTAAGGREVLSYDAAGVILEALRQGARNGDEVRQFLAELGVSRPPHPGISGPIAFQENGDAARNLVLGVIRVPPEEGNPPAHPPDPPGKPPGSSSLQDPGQ
ncbi:MAG: branched-chain amino acid ABC transporter substrate-binding protein [Gemmatimonadota bacterium]